MSPVQRQFHIYLEDILKSMLRITEYIDGKNFTDFKKNHMLVDAVVRNFEIIGEASKNIPLKIQKRYPEIPWKKMYGLRKTHGSRRTTKGSEDGYQGPGTKKDKRQKSQDKSSVKIKDKSHKTKVALR